MSLRIQRAGVVAGGRQPAWTPADHPSTIHYSSLIRSDRSESGGFVTQVDDLSTKGTHITFAGTTKPTYDATIFGGERPGLVFNAGTNEFGTIALGPHLVGASGVTILAAWIDTSTTARVLLEYGANGGASLANSFAVYGRIGNANSQTFYVQGNVGSNYWRGNANTELYRKHRVHSYRADFTAAGASEIKPIRAMGSALAGAQTGTANNTGAFSSQTLAVGAQTTGANPSRFVLGALVIVRECLSDEDLALFENYLSREFYLPFPAVMATRAVPRIIWGAPIQSNGMGQLDSYTEIVKWQGPHENPRIWAYKDYFTAGIWNTTPWAGIDENTGGWEGPDLVTCLSLMRHHGLAPELIMCAVGGTSLALQWDPATGTAYDRLVNTTYPTAISTHPSAPASVVPWIVNIHGESDAAVDADSIAYSARLVAFYEALGTDLPDLADAKIAIVQLHINSRNASANATTVGRIRAAQQAFVAANPGRAFLIDIDDLSLSADNVHFTQTTAIEVGRRIATVIGANT